MFTDCCILKGYGSDILELLNLFKTASDHLFCEHIWSILSYWINFCSKGKMTDFIFLLFKWTIISQLTFIHQKVGIFLKSFVCISACMWHDIFQVDELLKERDNIHSSFTTTRTLATSASGSSSSKVPGEEVKAESPLEDGNLDGKDKSTKKKWFNLNLKGSDKKLG